MRQPPQNGTRAPAAAQGANRISAGSAIDSALGLGRRQPRQRAGDVAERGGAGQFAECLVVEVQADADLVAQALAAAGAQARDQLADFPRRIQAVAGEQQAAAAIDQLEVELAVLRGTA